MQRAINSASQSGDHVGVAQYAMQVMYFMLWVSGSRVVDAYTCHYHLLCCSSLDLLTTACKVHTKLSCRLIINNVAIGISCLQKDSLVSAIALTYVGFDSFVVRCSELLFFDVQNFSMSQNRSSDADALKLELEELLAMFQRAEALSG